MNRSLAAGVNALCRARESKRPADNRILYDPWAQLFAERNIRIQLIRFGRFLLPPMQRMVRSVQIAYCVRARAIDELLVRAVEHDGFRQVVLIGAGYDMRSSRFGDQFGDVRWIEVDRPEMNAWKWARLEGIPDVNRRVETVSTDLLSESMLSSLNKTGFDQKVPTCFILDGIVHYMPLEWFKSLLTEVSENMEHARFIMSYIRSDMYYKATRLYVRLVILIREIPRIHFMPDGLEALFQRHGFGNFISLSHEQQREAFIGDIQRPRVKLSQDIAQADTGSY